MRLIVGVFVLCALAGLSYAEDTDEHYKRRLTEIAQLNFPRALQNLNRAEALEKAGKFEDARSRYRGAKQGAEVVASEFEEFLAAAPHLGTYNVPISDKGHVSSASNVLKVAKEVIALATQREAALAQKGAGESSAAKDAAIKSLAGDRKKVFGQRGNSLPRAWDGSTSTAPKTFFGSLKTSAYWMYEWSNGCSMTYRFKGNKLVKTETKPAGCSPL